MNLRIPALNSAALNTSVSSAAIGTGELTDALPSRPAYSGAVIASIRPAVTADIPSMQRIEIASGAMWREIGMDDVADDGAHETDELAGYVDGGRAWVAERDGGVCAYALADVYDGVAHLEQVTVDPVHARQRIGRTLIDAVAAWARANGSPALTLMTFREVPWNGPYYRRLGFADVPDDEL